VIETAHTSALPQRTLRAARALLDDVFAGEMTDSDWDHALGGVHALAWEDGELVGHASVVQRRLVCGGRARRTGYVEGVGVRADRRRRGIAGALMASLEDVIGRAYELGALGASEMAIPFYASRGWRAWEGPLAALTPDGVVATPDERGAVFVLGELDVTGTLLCDWRDGDVW
jgi:aminoglycoside 2'-N-acetyltransferase I